MSWWIAAMAVSCGISMGCAPQVGIGRATVQAPGKTRIGLALVPSLESAQLLPEQPVTGPWARLLGGVHRGISERVELGGRVWVMSIPTLGAEFGFAVDSKIALEKPARGKGTQVTLAPSLSYYQPRMPGAPWHAVGLTVPLLVGFDAGSHQFVVGPRVHFHAVGAYGMETIGYPGFGLSVGFFGRVRKTVDLSPELVWMYSPLPFGGEGTTDEARIGANSLQLALGGSWEVD